MVTLDNKMIVLTQNIKKSLLEKNNKKRIAILTPYPDKNGNYIVLRTIFVEQGDFKTFDPTKLKGDKRMVYNPKKKLFEWNTHIVYQGWFLLQNKKPPTWSCDSEGYD